MYVVLSLFFPFQNSIILLVFQTHLRKNCRLPLPTLGPTTDMPTGPPGSTQGCNCSTYTAVSTRSQGGQHAGKNWTGRQNALEQKQTCNRHESNPKFAGPATGRSPRICQEDRWHHTQSRQECHLISTPPWRLLPQLEPPMGQNRGGALKAYNQSRGQSESAGWPSIRKTKQNKKPLEHTMLQTTFQQHLWHQYCKSWTIDKIQTPSSLPQRGPARWVTFPRGGSVGSMSFWQVSPFHSLPFSSTNWPPAWGQRGEMIDSKAILQCQKKMYLAFFSFFLF